MAYEDTLEDLYDWFKELKLDYTLSHDFKTLSGTHYVFHSEEENGKQISVEMFANRYDGLYSNVCMIVNGKATQSVECFDISVDDGIEAWKRKLAEMENILVNIR